MTELQVDGKSLSQWVEDCKARVDAELDLYRQVDLLIDIAKIEDSKARALALECFMTALRLSDLFEKSLDSLNYVNVGYILSSFGGKGGE